MPTLNWIGKENVINHHHDVAFRTLDEKYTFIADDRDASNASANHSENKIIHGDNLEALKALLPEYEGRIKCIYIDPPYNTGASPENGGWIYYDNVDSPRIRKWLGQVVGKESEDLSRHDKWLCMMYPRLKLLQKLLSDDGAIFISIDDNEQANLKLICDEIFGAGNFVACYLWNKTSTPPALSKKVRRTHEYILCYNKNNDDKKYVGLINEDGDAPLLNEINKEVILSFPANYVTTNLKNGVYEAGEKERVTLLDDVEVINGKIVSPFRLKGHFRWIQETLDDEIKEHCKLIVKSEKFAIRYCRQNDRIVAPPNFITERFYLGTAIDKTTGVDTNEKAGKELYNILGKKIFNFPKPNTLIAYFINFLCDKNSIILDSFAGSGTTAHAVLNLNKADGGHRKFILVEMEDYAETITAERVRRVIKGYGEGKNTVEGTGGSFSFYELGETVFNEDGYLNESVGTEKIKEYIWYSETHTPYVGAKNKTQYLLGQHNGTAYYFYYEREKITTLSHETLNVISQKAETYVVYADQCVIDSEWLSAHNIIFKKIPRDIRRF